MLRRLLRAITIYFSPSKGERMGFMVICTLLFVTLIAIKVYERLNPPKDLVVKVEELSQVSPAVTQDSLSSTDASSTTPKTSILQDSLFAFNPNELTQQEAKQLGIPAKVFKTMQNFRSKGGKFNQAKDLEKIYGMNKSLSEKLMPYVVLNTEFNKPSELNKNTYSFTPSRKSEINKIDINDSDTADWSQLPGIGKGFATRILKYRKALGGFIKTDQVSETFGLPDSSFQKIKPYLLFEPFALRRVWINDATVEELKAHPYISNQLASAIVRYRQLNGKYRDLNDLKNLSSMNDELFIKLKPYLAI